MKINVDLINSDKVKELVNSYQRNNNSSNNNNSNNIYKNIEIFFSKEQKDYELKCTQLEPNNYNSLYERMYDIISLLKKKKNLKSSDFKLVIDKSIPSDTEINCDTCINIDPYLIRNVFYFITQILFNKSKTDQEQEIDTVI